MDDLFDEAVTVVAATDDEPVIGTCEVRFCRAADVYVEMEYIGEGDGPNGNPGWLCLHDLDDDSPVR